MKRGNFSFFMEVFSKLGGEKKMNKVFKYPVPVEDRFSLDLPQGARILTVQEQNSKPQIWAIVNPENPTEIRNFRLAGAGHPIEENEKNLSYIGTFQLYNGNFIGHLFEIFEIKE